jgi:Fe-S-cluster containining protein
MINQLIPSGVCLKCKGCCRFAQEDSVWAPSLLNGEIDSLSKAGLAPSMITPQKKIRVANFNKENIFICSLFNPEGHICKIYSARPFECQLYPFLLKRKNNKIFLAVDLNCPFAKENIKSSSFTQHVQYLTGLLKGPQYAAILKNNPQVTQEYPEAEELGEL